MSRHFLNSRIEKISFFWDLKIKSINFKLLIFN